MHIYTAAVYSNGYMAGQSRYKKLEENEREIVHGLPHILESYHYVGKQTFVDEMRANGAKVFLDSGAFSAYTLGATLSLEAYCQYIFDNQDIIRVEDGCLMASVLDGIGNAEETWINQLKMEAWFHQRGLDLKPLPCFHFGEPTSYLERYVRDYEYITLGGMVGASTEQLRNWLEKIWDGWLLDKTTGRAKIKVHGFGITAVPLMEEFDWYSCDSSSWIQSAAFGSIVLPGVSRRNPAMPIAVSSKSPSRHDVGQHITTLSQPEREYLHSVLARNGFTEDRVAEVYESRASYNLWAFGEVNKLMDERRRTSYTSGKQQDLFENRL